MELDQRNPPGVCPFVRSILGRAGTASKSKRQSSARGKRSLPAWCGEEELQQCCCQGAGNCLSTESPATDQQYWIFYLEAAFQGKITLTGLERSQLNGCVKILMVCQNQQASWRFVGSEKIAWNNNEKTLKKSDNLVQFFNMECFNFSVSK